jgi:nucleoside-diphosphate-sugar epimerase
MKALVTGGAGFIGSHLAEALCRRGAHVVALDNLSSGSLRNLDWRRGDDGLEFVEGDIRDKTLLAKVVPGCDWVFHEAALASVPYSVAMPLESNAHNLEGTLNLLVAARDAGVKRFLFASSSAIYGDDETALKNEGLPPNPLSPYALQKYGGEKYAHFSIRFTGWKRFRCAISMSSARARRSIRPIPASSRNFARACCAAKRR